MSTASSASHSKGAAIAPDGWTGLRSCRYSPHYLIAKLESLDRRETVSQFDSRLSFPGTFRQEPRVAAGRSWRRTLAKVLGGCDRNLHSLNVQ